MVKYGRSARWYNDYNTEIEFCTKNGFDFMQIWYREGKLLYDNMAEPKEKAILEADFPIILHALFTIDDYDKYAIDLLRILKFLHHGEVIIHPVCFPVSLINCDTIRTLSEHNKKITEMYFQEGIKVYIENNGREMPLNYTPEDLAIVFRESPQTELLLDIAHIDNYEHLGRLINVKFPKCLHIADRHFAVGHEHLPVGKGDIDFQSVFSKYLNNFDGKIIFEVVSDNDGEIVNSKNMIRDIISGDS